MLNEKPLYRYGKETGTYDAIIVNPVDVATIPYDKLYSLLNPHRYIAFMYPSTPHDNYRTLYRSEFAKTDFRSDRSTDDFILCRKWIAGYDTRVKTYCSFQFNFWEEVNSAEAIADPLKAVIHGITPAPPIHKGLTRLLYYSTVPDQPVNERVQYQLDDYKHNIRTQDPDRPFEYKLMIDLSHK